MENVDFLRGIKSDKGVSRMKEHGIIFQGWGVRAILEGRKTITRRVIKPQPEIVDAEPRYRENTWAFWSDKVPKYRGELIVHCPYGKPGDLLWVRETWAIDQGDQSVIFYRATDDKTCGNPWRPSIHMPRKASRITLRIADGRVERVQEITEEDAKAEGIQAEWIDVDGKTIYGSGNRFGFGLDDQAYTQREAFAKTWDSIYAKRGFGWDANPFVWVIAFERIET